MTGAPPPEGPWGHTRLHAQPREGEEGAVQHRRVQVAVDVQYLRPCGGRARAPGHLQEEAGGQQEAVLPPEQAEPRLVLC